MERGSCRSVPDGAGRVRISSAGTDGKKWGRCVPVGAARALLSSGDLLRVRKGRYRDLSPRAVSLRWLPCRRRAAHPSISSVQWKVQGGSPEGTLAWVRQIGCFGADDKVVLASTGREAYASGGFDPTT